MLAHALAKVRDFPFRRFPLSRGRVMVRIRVKLRVGVGIRV